jgi:hypothetical protein
MLMPMLMPMLTTTNAGMNAQNVVLLESGESVAAMNDRLVEKFFSTLPFHTPSGWRRVSCRTCHVTWI